MLLTLALATALFGQFESVRAQQESWVLPTEPILRIDPGGHNGMINRIDTDAANRFLVTASYDKTVRVWSLPDGQLQRALRVPIGHGRMGSLYAVAISPDGDTIAVGGETGAAPHYNIFLFDRASGVMKQRLSDLPSIIENLVYSADGQWLAASLERGNGIRVFDALNDYRLVPSDTQYGEASYGAHFDRIGRLVTTSDDGFIRLYAANRYGTPVARFNWRGHKPFSAVFSPDGSRVAIGAADSHNVVVLSGSDLTQPFQPDTTGIPADAAMAAVSWSQDGDFLYAGGTWSNNENEYQVRRWSNGGRGRHLDVPVASITIPQLIRLKSGSILVGSHHGLSTIGPDAKVSRLQVFGALDLAGWRGLRVSADSGIVEVKSREPPHVFRFSVADRLVKIDPRSDNSLKESTTRAPALHITNWDYSTTPVVNGARIKLQDFDQSLSIAIVPRTQRFVLATYYSLRLLDQRGKDVWSDAPVVPEVPWDVNVSSNLRLVVVKYGDGAIRWYRLSDGRELLTLFMHPDGQRWVLWTPQGYYDASVGSDELIGWHINHGYDRAPDFYPVSQFRERFYRPDVIQRIFRTPNLDVEEAVRDADQAAGRATPRAVSVRSLLTPVVEINDPKNPAAVDRADITIGYSVRLPSPGDTLRVETLVDAVRVAAEDRRLVDSGGTRAGILHLTIPRRDSTVSVLAYNENGAGEPAKVQIKWRGPGTDPKLTLYVSAIGISEYKDKSLPQLHYASKDAADFVALAKAQEGGLYEKVITRTTSGSLRDSEATREAILDELDWIRSAVTNTNDVAMIFLAGHGITTPDQHYRFLPHDYDANRLARTTITDSELQDYLTKIGGKRIFFFDTCYSGAVLTGRATTTLPNVDKFANDLRTAQNGIVVFTSSTGNELSLERDEWMNGAFTKAVVEGLRGAAAQPQAPVVMISDLEGYVSRRVRDLTGGNQKPMVAKPNTVEDYPISARLQ